MSEIASSARESHDYPHLISLAVHELRSPASVVNGYLRMLQRDPSAPLSERQQKMVEEAEKSCARLVALINELSEIAKLDAGTATMQQQSVDIFKMIAEVAELVHEPDDRGVQLKVAGDESGAVITGDRTRLEAAFLSFIRAILREQPASCTVVVDRRRVAAEGISSAVVTVAESSIVVPSYNAPRAHMNDKRGGLGLALPIAKRVIELHGGLVWSPAIPKASAIIASLPIGG